MSKPPTAAWDAGHGRYGELEKLVDSCSWVLIIYREKRYVDHYSAAVVQIKSFNSENFFINSPSTEQLGLLAADLRRNEVLTIEWAENEDSARNSLHSKRWNAPVIEVAYTGLLRRTV